LKIRIESNTLRIWARFFGSRAGSF